MSGTWTSIAQARTFVVNMDRCVERWEVSKKRIEDAGFCNVERFRATDAAHDDLKAAWAQHGSPKFDPSDKAFVTYPGTQGCMLSHLNIWKKMIDENIEVAVIFEDDVLFHTHWSTLAPRYYEATPKDFDILFMGNQIEHMIDGHIIQTPVFCTHAYVITQKGARILYERLLQDPLGLRAIDCMLIDHMKAKHYRGVPCPFVWYVWNGSKFPDKSSASKDPRVAKRNTGLVFQDIDLGTFIRPWH